LQGERVFDNDGRPVMVVRGFKIERAFNEKLAEPMTGSSGLCANTYSTDKPVRSPASEASLTGGAAGTTGWFVVACACRPAARPPGLASSVVNDTRGPSGLGAGYLRPARFPRPSPVVWGHAGIPTGLSVAGMVS
jgi:hypothetical protein